MADEAAAPDAPGTAEVPEGDPTAIGRTDIERAALTADQLGRVHLVGIGGAGMSGIARILLARGLEVSGSDAKDSRTLTALRALGAEIRVGHDAELVRDADTVVVSTAIRESNVELAAARAAGIRVLRRAEALGAVMAGSVSIAVAGTHGKTTTTSMLTVALQACGLDPSFAIGGDLNESGANAHHGNGELFVAEADESDGSFLLLRPDVVVVTNVEPDHLDHYGDGAAVDDAFDAFVASVPPSGFVVACADDPGSARVAEVARARGVDVRTYGTGEADLRIESVQLDGTTSSFELVQRGVRLGRFELSVPGEHNVLNGAGAVAAALGVGAPVEGVREGLAAYAGTRRRFEPKGEAAGVRLYDDYAHHPTELVATLRAAREVADGSRLVAVFQPHRYSRTEAFLTEFGAALALADDVVVMEVYAAGEDAVPGASGAALAAAVPLPAESVVFEPSWSAVPDLVVSRLRPGDLVLTLGAGDVTMIGPEVLARLDA